MSILNASQMTIRWRLAAVMADREIDYKQLAEMTGFNKVTVSRHKNLREMPDRLEKETLNAYCKALQCEPGELLRYQPDEEPASEAPVAIAS
ncbi:MAG: helix-turn-helix transcriptional regulator [Myxacorys chilensis ATA2-1-KO14]|nr:helix-turn-helix transcriptional regulator [Myxacorys chilensis ATA2-1-KO14]